MSSCYEQQHLPGTSQDAEIKWRANPDALHPWQRHREKGLCSLEAKVWGNGRLSIIGAQKAEEVIAMRLERRIGNTLSVKVSFNPSSSRKPWEWLRKGGDILILYVEGFLADGWLAQKNGSVDAAQGLLTSMWNYISCKHLPSVQLWEVFKSQEGLRETFHSLLKYDLSSVTQPVSGEAEIGSSIHARSPMISLSDPGKTQR